VPRLAALNTVTDVTTEITGLPPHAELSRSDDRTILVRADAPFYVSATFRRADECDRFFALAQYHRDGWGERHITGVPLGAGAGFAGVDSAYMYASAQSPTESAYYDRQSGRAGPQHGDESYIYGHSAARSGRRGGGGGDMDRSVLMPPHGPTTGLGDSFDGRGGLELSGTHGAGTTYAYSQPQVGERSMRVGGGGASTPRSPGVPLSNFAGFATPRYAPRVTIETRQREPRSKAVVAVTGYPRTPMALPTVATTLGRQICESLDAAGFGGEIVLLSDAENPATRDRIRDSLLWLFRDVMVGDSLYFHFVGRTREREFHEGGTSPPVLLHQVIVPTDTDICGDITAEYFLALIGMLPPGIRCYYVFDTCGFAAPVALRNVYDWHLSDFVEDHRVARNTSADVFCLTSVQPALADDARGVVGPGALSEALCLLYGRQLSWRDLIRAGCTKMRRAVVPQGMHLETSLGSGFGGGVSGPGGVGGGGAGGGAVSASSGLSPIADLNAFAPLLDPAGTNGEANPRPYRRTCFWRGDAVPTWAPLRVSTLNSSSAPPPSSAFISWVQGDEATRRTIEASAAGSSSSRAAATSWGGFGSLPDSYSDSSSGGSASRLVASDSGEVGGGNRSRSRSRRGGGGARRTRSLASSASSSSSSSSSRSGSSSSHPRVGRARHSTPRGASSRHAPPGPQVAFPSSSRGKKSSKKSKKRGKSKGSKEDAATSLAAIGAQPTSGVVLDSRRTKDIHSHRRRTGLDSSGFSPQDARMARLRGDRRSRSESTRPGSHSDDSSSS
jgi:hypothetical protein